MNRYFRLNDSDNVAVVLFDAQPGDKLDFEGLHVTVTEPVPYGHKVALCNFHTGDIVYKYGYSIGRCIRDTPQGGWMHIHNIVSCRVDAEK